MLKQEKISKDKAPSFGDVKYGGAAGTKFFALTADRTAGNMMEQSLPFLIALWLHGLFVSPIGAAKLGWCWLASRALYPVAFARGMPWLLLSTGPGYVFVVMLLWPIWQKTLG